MKNIIKGIGWVLYGIFMVAVHVIFGIFVVVSFFMESIEKDDFNPHPHFHPRRK